MIVGSLLLILVAIVLLIAGLFSGSAAALSGSIATSLLAGVALLAGVRHAAPAAQVPHPRAGVELPPRMAAGVQARLAGLSDPVWVVPDEPFFHLHHCSELLGADGRETPVSVAVGAGLASCDSCRAADVLMADMPRG